MKEDLKAQLLSIIHTLLKCKLSAAKGNLRNHNLGSVDLELMFIKLDLKRMEELLRDNSRDEHEKIP